MCFDACILSIYAERKNGLNNFKEIGNKYVKDNNL